MNIVFIVSILLKGVGAILEILLQILITKQIGVTLYGSYSALVNLGDLLYWCLFSGIVKCNTFYLAEQHTTIRTFKEQFLKFYILPVTLVGFALGLLTQMPNISIAFAIALTELLVMDQSSSFMARRFGKRALFGEYVLGRFVLLLGVAGAFAFSITDVLLLAMLYLGQFLVVLLYFLLQRRQLPRHDLDRTVSMKKLADYQRADIIQSMIAQMPVILPYMIVGSFEAGVVSVVMLVKKLVNFISGPSFKIFLPEFSRLYQAGDRASIKNCFSAIIRMQMLFLAPMSVVLIGFPCALLRVMADELTAYSGLFILCSVTFIIVASLGPCSGLMQMTGNERWDNRFREIALIVMFIVFAVLRENPFFVLYGLCVQAALENLGKLLFIAHWMEGLPMKLTAYLRLWLLPCAVITGSYCLGLQDSIPAMLLLSGVTFIVRGIQELRDGSLLSSLQNRQKQKE